jgi:hypothetical protein
VTEALLLIVTLLVAGAMAGLTAGLFGNGGGFVVVPALLFVFGVLGYQEEGLIYVAVGTSLATIVISSFRAAVTHHKLGSVDREVLRTWGPWLILGVGIGVYLASLTDARGLTLVFAGGVGIYSLYFLFPTLLDKCSFSHLPSGVPRASLATFLGGFSALLGIGGGTAYGYHYDPVRTQHRAGGGYRYGCGFHYRLGGLLGLLPDRFDAVDNHRPTRVFGIREFTGAAGDLCGLTDHGAHGVQSSLTILNKLC